MKRILQEIIVRLLYLTPVGYFLSLLSLQMGNKTPGVYIDIPHDTPMTAHIKQNPIFTDRMQWFLNGVFLLSQAAIIIWQELGGTLGSTYAWIALVFGVVTTTSSFFPTFPWNKRFGIIKISILEISVVLFLIVSIGLSSM